jgi:serine/threonine protein kinase
MARRASMQTMSPQLAAGTVLGGTYRIVRLIGRGAMGDVYEATHARLAGRYALKVLAAAGMDSEDLVRRFRREAEVTSGLRHPNIVHVVDFNTTPDRRPYLVMELLEGTELTTEIKRAGAMPIARVLDLVGQIASALAAAHAQQVVHRDLKPQNLFLVSVPGEEREIVKVVDFGISKVREATTQLTQETAIMGTPQYMAPEQAQGRLAEIDGRSDQFALGVITYELLAGQAAFRGGTIPSLLYQVVHEQPEPIRGFNPKVPPAMEAVILRALAKRREERYPSVRDFHRELVLAARAAAPEDLAAAPAPGPAPSPLPGWIEHPELQVTTFGKANGQVHPVPTRRGRGALAGGLGVLALALGGFLWLRNGTPAIDPPPAVPAVISPAAVAPAPALPSTVAIDVIGAPAGLHVLIDGAPATPPLALPRGPARHRLVFSAPGFQPLSIELAGQRAQSVDLRTMVSEAKAEPVKKPAASHPSAAPHRTTRPRPSSVSESRPPKAEPLEPKPSAPPASKRGRPLTDL